MEEDRNISSSKGNVVLESKGPGADLGGRFLDPMGIVGGVRMGGFDVRARAEGCVMGMNEGVGVRERMKGGRVW